MLFCNEHIAMPPRAILIADDDRLLRESLCDALSFLGCEARSVGNASEAIEMLGNQVACDLLLSDVDMPDMTGFQLLAWARDHQHGEPTVLMSARATADLGREARRLGAVTLLAKPVPTAELNAVVSAIFS